METSIASWIFLGIIFVLFIISCIILISNAQSSKSKQSSLDDPSYNKPQQDKVNYWKVVRGNIVESTIDFRDHKKFLGRTVRQYRTRVTYEYFAYDQNYRNSTALNQWTPKKAEAKQLLEKHQSEDTVVVRFHPKSPEISTIQVNQ